MPEQPPTRNFTDWPPRCPASNVSNLKAGLTLKNSACCPHCIYVFCVAIRIIFSGTEVPDWFYKQEEVCLLRGANCMRIIQINPSLLKV
jgi:hypothetical protein